MRRIYFVIRGDLKEMDKLSIKLTTDISKQFGSAIFQPSSWTLGFVESSPGTVVL
jgi:hypothetical protein